MEAIKKIRDEWFDVIILDYAMPGFDGVDAAKWIKREITGFVQPRLIALSANTQDMLSNEIGADKVFDHVEQKPWNPRSLLSILQASKDEPRRTRLEQPHAAAARNDRAISAVPPPGHPPEDDDEPLLRVTTCLEKVRVLIVDEEESVLSTFRASLEQANYDVRLANGQAEAVRILGREAFDIVFSDYFGAAKFCGSPAAFLRQAGRPGI